MSQHEAARHGDGRAGARVVTGTRASSANDAADVIAADNAQAISPKDRRIDGPSSPTKDQRALLTASEVAQLLAVPTSWVYAQSRAGRIPTVTYLPRPIR
jgi:hypothetical protein